LQEGGHIHPFWLSHEEKRDCVRLSMGGGHGWPWGARRRGERGGRWRGVGGAAGSAAWGEGGLQEGRRACSLAATAASLPSVVREKETGRRKKKERRKEKEGKEK
jgi:hypothetical protein